MSLHKVLCPQCKSIHINTHCETLLRQKKKKGKYDIDSRENRPSDPQANSLDVLKKKGQRRRVPTPWRSNGGAMKRNLLCIRTSIHEGRLSFNEQIWRENCNNSIRSCIALHNRGHMLKQERPVRGLPRTTVATQKKPY